MKPENALNSALYWVYIDQSKRVANVPGAVIERLSEEQRIALQDLKSDHIAESTHFHQYWVDYIQAIDYTYKSGIET